jgi:hypothetical protein
MTNTNLKPNSIFIGAEHLELTSLCQCAHPDIVVNEMNNAAFCAICGGDIPPEEVEQIVVDGIMDDMADARREARFGCGL